MQHKTLDVITLFHKASSPASLRVLALLKQASATASAHATEDQASDHTAQSQPRRPEFELEITEEPPTEDQLHSILEYVGAQRAGEIISGAKNETDALKKLKTNKDSFQRPLVCFPPSPPPALPLLLHYDDQVADPGEDGRLE
jgi:arsenate reductase-like glutaredoxin family protein